MLHDLLQIAFDWSDFHQRILPVRLGGGTNIELAYEDGNRNSCDQARKKRDRMRFHNWTVLPAGLARNRILALASLSDSQDEVAPETLFRVKFLPERRKVTSGKFVGADKA